MGVGVAEAKVETVGHLAAQRNGCAMTDAGGFALEYIDCSKLRNRSGQRIDAWRKRASQAGAELPRGKGLHCAIAQQVHTGGIENRILHFGGWEKIYVAGANQILSVNKRIGDF